MLPESAELVFFAAFALAFAFVFAPAAAPRRSLLWRGGAGLAGTIAIVAVPTFELVLLTLLTLGVLNAAADGKQPFALRLRAPVLAVAVFALGLVLARAAGPEVLDRFAAVGLVAGLAAGIGLLPYLHPFDPDDAVTGSPIAWMAFIGPALAVVVAGTRGLVPAEAGGVFGAMLIGVGLLNVAWGGVAAWLTESTVAAWRYSFIADWGLALCGFGLMVVDGRRAALLLRGATQLFWPLGLVLALGMLLWLPGSLRLGRSLGVPRGRQALGVALVLALNVAVGLYPLPLLEAARL